MTNPVQIVLLALNSAVLKDLVIPIEAFPPIHRSTRPGIRMLYGSYAHTKPYLWHFPVS